MGVVFEKEEKTTSENPASELERHAVGLAITLPFNLPFGNLGQYDVSIWGKTCSITFLKPLESDEPDSSPTSKLARFAVVRIAFPGAKYEASEDDFIVEDEERIREFAEFIDDFGESDFTYLESVATMTLDGQEVARIEGREASKTYGIGMQYLIYLLAICRDVAKFFFIPYVSDEFLSSGDLFMARIVYYFPGAKQTGHYKDTLSFFNPPSSLSREQEEEIRRRLSNREGVPVVDELLLLANEDYRRGALNPAIVEFQAAFEGKIKAAVKSHYETQEPGKYTEEQLYNILRLSIKNIIRDHYVKCFPNCVGDDFERVYKTWESAYKTRKMIVHQNFDYELCERPAKDAIRDFDLVFKYFFGQHCIFDYAPSAHNK